MKKYGLALALTCVTLLAQERTAQPEPVKLEPQVEAVLRKMDEHLRSTKTFRFRTRVDWDLPEDPSLRFGAVQNVTVKRPNGLRVDYRGDLTQRLITFDGETLSMLNPPEELFARMKAGPTIDDALDALFDKGGFNIPMADFVYSDPFEALTEGVMDSAYVGKGMVGPWWCHHLVIRQPYIDIQIWVDAGARPLPRKIVFTYKRVEHNPQFTAVFEAWEFDPDLPAFTIAPPVGAVEGQFVTTMKKGGR